MVKPQNRRRQIIVNKKYQNRIVFAISWPPALCLVLTSLAIGVFCWNLSVEALEADVELTSLAPLFLTTISFLVLAAGFQFFSALKFSHDLAGPTVNIARVLKSVRDGDLSARIHLRKRDLVQDVAEEINALLDWLEDHPQLKTADGAVQTPEAAQTPEPETQVASSASDPKK